jgi:mannitol-1-/sugar-/sorbitol-6-/2-deoxyglucose-6-phosphatase
MNACLPTVRVDAVVFDMDGVLIDSEAIWQRVREDFAAALGRIWTHEDQVSTMGLSTAAWARFMVDRLGLRGRPGYGEAEVAMAVIEAMQARYAAALPQREGAVQAVRRVASRYKVALASGSPRALGETVLAVSGLSDLMQTTVYGDEVDNGKPAPDIYLRALRDIGVAPEHAVGVEDSGNGIRALAAAGMGIIAAPMPGFAPAPDVIALAGVQLASMAEFELVHVELAAQRLRPMPLR